MSKTTTTGHTRDSSKGAWACMKVTRIPNLMTGAIYLWRLRLIETPWFGLFLHKIMEADNDRNHHDHPWNFRSLILWGGYTEDKVTLDYRVPDAPMKDHLLTHYSAGDVNNFREGEFHCITHLKNGEPCWSLVLVGRRKSEWGFLVGVEKVLKSTYIPERMRLLGRTILR